MIKKTFETRASGRYQSPVVKTIKYQVRGVLLEHTGDTEGDDYHEGDEYDEDIW